LNTVDSPIGYLFLVTAESASHEESRAVVAADLVEVSFLQLAKTIDGSAIPQVGLTRFLFAALYVLSRASTTLLRDA